MQDFGAQNAVLAVARFQIAVGAERAHRHLPGQSAAQVMAPAAKAGVKHCDGDAAAAKAKLMPTARAQLFQEFLTRAGRSRIRRRLPPQRRYGRAKRQAKTTDQVAQHVDAPCGEANAVVSRTRELISSGAKAQGNELSEDAARRWRDGSGCADRQLAMCGLCRR